MRLFPKYQHGISNNSLEKNNNNNNIIINSSKNDIYNAYKDIISSCEYYYVIDINDDDIIELVVLEGTCTADYKFVFYTYRNSEAIKLGENSASSSSLYKMKDGNHLKQINTRMDHEVVYDIYYLNDKLNIQKTSSRELTYQDYQTENFAKGDILLKMYEKNDLSPFK